MGLFVLLVVALLSATLWHRFVPRYAIAVVGATLSTAVAFQVIAFIQLGYLDPFFLIAAATSGGLALLIAIVVGLPFRARRSRIVVHAAPTEGSRTQSN
jgi:hypothetical protein